ncbi:MAG: ankyrin repeat domain-containing protein [Flavobacteriaceae bacterium]
MRKTILTAAALCLMAVTGIYAIYNSTVNEPLTELTTSVSYDVNPFCKAIMNGDVDTVKKLIELGEDINAKSVGLTPAMFAARYNKAEILQILIEDGANLKVKSDRGLTAKMYAERSKATEALAVLDAAMKKK